MEPIYVNLVVEDSLSESATRALLVATGRSYCVSTPFVGHGYGYIKTRINGFNRAAQGIPFVVLTDLDTAECAPALMDEWLTGPQHPNLLFRVAVREVEAWLLADRSSIARFLGIQVDLVPQTYDNDPDPKRTLINLARRSPYGELRRDIVPRANSTSQQGPGYNARMVEFVQQHWSVDSAALHSASLAKALGALRRFEPLSEQPDP